MKKYISTQELKTEKGIFILQQEDFKITMTLVQDLNDEMKVFPKPISISFDSRIMTYDDILLKTEYLLNEATEINDLANAMSEKKEPHIQYDSNTILDIDTQNKFLDELKTYGRVYYRLDNQSVITICRPLLGFENKDEAFKTNRHNVEKQFWKERIDSDKFNNDMKVIAKIMIELF